MPNPFPASIRRLSLSLALGVSFCSSAWSQVTAPQLIPYTVKLIAGSGATLAKGATCPVSGNITTDAYGDGCLAIEINIAPTSTTGTGARYAIADKTGAVFFSDATNGLVRRVDPATGIVTAVAGGATSSPASGVACGTGVSTDANGDGCPANLVKLSHPMGLAFDAAGNLYFADNGYDDVRRVLATAGVVTTTGVISNVAGNISTYGYNVSNSSASGPVIAATQSYLNFPYGLAFDAAGNLYVADEGNNAIEVINLTAATETIQGQSLPAGTISKFAGYGSLAAKTAASGECPDFVSTSSRGGCYFGKWTDGSLANSSNNDGVYSIAVDAASNVYFGNEFNDNVGFISSANVISNYAGIQGSVLKKLQRGVAGSFAIGSTFGIAVDANANTYITDASNGVVWRVDSAGKSMYVVAGGATTVCSVAADSYGDGCPATQATFGSSGTTFASTTLPGPGIFGVTVDAYSNLFVGDTETGLIREIASGTQFGNVGANQTVTQNLEIHFAANDTPAASAYTITTGGSIFSLGAAACVANSDATTDCVLPISASPTGLGAFAGTLQATSSRGGVASFPLSGIAVSTPITRISVSAAAGSACSGSTTYSSPFATTLTAIVTSSGSPTGTVTFFANGVQIGTPQTVNSGVATLPFTFTTPASYKITATYNGDTYFHASTTVAGISFLTSAPTFTASAITYQQNSVAAGQTGLYSFNIVQNVYTGTIAFTVTGLPSNSSVSFSPQTLTATGCSTTNTVAFSILTQQGPVSSGFGTGGSGFWPIASMVAGFGLALLIGLQRRRSSIRFGQLWMVLALLLATSGMVACGSGTTGGARTPAGTYTVAITATGSTGVTSAFTVPLTVK